MNFLIFSAQYLPHVGGVENYTYNLSRCLASRGHEVTIVTSNVNNLSSYEKKEEATILRFDCYDLLNGKYPVLKRNANYKKLMSNLDKQKYDFCIVNTRFYIHSIVGMKYAKKYNIPIITIDHGTAHLTVDNKIFDFLGAIYEHSLTWLGKRYCHDYYGVSKASVNWLSHFNIKAKGVLYNAIDLSDIESKKRNKELSYREIYNLSDDDFLFVYTGRLVKEKGLLQLTEAFNKLFENYSNIYLMIAGDGELRDKLNLIKSDYVILLGRLNFNQVVSLLDDSDAFCLPSDSEGFSTSLLEAAICNSYIIVTNRGGAKEVLLDDTFGCVIEENDVDSVYEALEKAYLMKAKDRESAISKTYKRVCENYTWEITTNKILKIAKHENENSL